MALLTVIGRGVRIRGRVAGEGDLTIEGHVEGEVAIAGEVTIEAGGLVGAHVTARVLVVRGAVRGDLTAEEVVRLEEGARVVGDIRAPRIAIAKGALVRGLVQTGSASAALPRPRAQAQAAAPKAAPVAARRPAPAAPAAQKAPAPAAPPAARPAPVPQRPAAPPAAAPAPAPVRHATPATLAGAAPPAQAARRPPAPLVPALKKGAKAALKKKAT